jgi:hypothetical protein
MNTERRLSGNVLAVLVPLFSAGCGAELLANVSAGQIGCPPDEIVIEHDSGPYGNSRTWQATCHGATFQCSVYGSHVAGCTALREPRRAAAPAESAAAVAATPPPPLSSGELPKELSEEQLRFGMSQVQDEVEGCQNTFRSGPGDLVVDVVIGSDGQVRRTKATGGSLLNTKTALCVEGQIEKAHFPRFAGPPMQIQFPYAFSH